MILIISNTEDLTTDFVVRELTRRDIAFSRLNTDEFPSHGKGTASFGFNTFTRRVILWNNRLAPLDFNSVRAVLYRRPLQPVPNPAIEDPHVRRFCADESYEFLRGLWISLDCFWMSHPDAIRKAEHKIYQLQIAQYLPFKIPRTVITNDPEEVRTLFAACTDGIIIKPLYLGFIGDPKATLYIYTSIVSRDDLQYMESVEFAPSIYQERIIKECDIRVTVVGERIFAARIDADPLPPNIPDWRYLDPQHLRHSTYHLPPEIEKACLDLVNSLGLEFGAIDLALDTKGEYVFFEINPNGQWAWLEKSLGFKISEAIVDRLIAGSEENRK